MLGIIGQRKDEREAAERRGNGQDRRAFLNSENAAEQRELH